MVKLTQNEAIGIGASLIVALIFVPTVLSIHKSAASSSNQIGQYSEKNTVKENDIQNNVPDANVIKDLETDDIIEGDGKEAKIGDTLYVHYVGQLENGDTFDTSTYVAEPFVLQLGVGQVIAGWDLGLAGMREGGTRRLVIPSELAYGPREISDLNGTVIIPANSTLVFDVVLLHVDEN